MRELIISALLLLPAAAYSQGADGIEDMPGLSEQQGEVPAAAPVQRPDAQRIMAELSSALRLSSKQEERIGAAVKKKTAEFEKLLKEFEKNAAEEKKWRFKANEARYNMARINRELPDTVREYLDDEQREAYGELLGGKKKASAAAAPGAAPRPAAKKKVLKRKKAAAPAPEISEEESGVMVDGDTPRPAPRKKILKKKKLAPRPAPAPAPEESAAEEEAAPAEQGGKDADEEDAAAYP